MVCPIQYLSFTLFHRFYEVSSVSYSWVKKREFLRINSPNRGSPLDDNWQVLLPSRELHIMYVDLYHCLRSTDENVRSLLGRCLKEPRFIVIYRRTIQSEVSLSFTMNEKQVCAVATPEKKRVSRVVRTTSIPYPVSGVLLNTGSWVGRRDTWSGRTVFLFSWFLLTSLSVTVIKSLFSSF